MKKAVADGTIVEYGGVRYEFATIEDAEGFAGCINSGGRPASCAEAWRCISKRAVEIERDDGLSM